MIDFIVDEVKKTVFINIPPVDREHLANIARAIPQERGWSVINHQTDGIIWWVLTASTELEFMQQSTAMINFYTAQGIPHNLKWNKAPAIAARLLDTAERYPSSSTHRMIQVLQVPVVASIPLAPLEEQETALKQRKKLQEKQRRDIEHVSLQAIREELKNVLNNPGAIHHQLLLNCLNGSSQIPDEKFKLLQLMANYLHVVHRHSPAAQAAPPIGQASVEQPQESEPQLAMNEEVEYNFSFAHQAASMFAPSVAASGLARGRQIPDPLAMGMEEAPSSMVLEDRLEDFSEQFFVNDDGDDNLLTTPRQQ